jgi:hypothetical protein
MPQDLGNWGNWKFQIGEINVKSWMIDWVIGIPDSGIGIPVHS